MKKSFFSQILATIVSLVVIVSTVTPISYAATQSDTTLQNFIQNELNINKNIDLSEQVDLGAVVEWMGKALDINTQNIQKAPYENLIGSESYAPFVNIFYKIGALPRVNAYKKVFEGTKKMRLYSILEMLLYVEGIPVPRILDNINARDIDKNAAIAPVMQKSIELGLIDTNDGFARPYTSTTYRDLAELLYRYVHSDTQTRTTPVQPDINITIPTSSGSDTGIQGTDAQFFDEIVSTVLSKYLRASDISASQREELFYSALEGFVDELNDKHSIFLRPADGDNLQDTLSGEFEGIGAYIGQDENGRITITAPIKGSPAAKAGLKTNDIIIRVDGEGIIGQSLSQVIQKIKGPRGSTVKLTIERKDETTNTTETFNFDVTRDTIKVDSVTKENIQRSGKDIALVSINQFGAKTTNEFNAIVTQLDSEQPDGIILDMRGNPGGFLDAAVHILGYFMRPGEIAVQIKYPTYTVKRETGSTGSPLFDFPVVVMINHGSASASEIVAGALREQKNAPLVGDTSYGKGTVQELLYYQNGSSLKLTVAEYTLPSGKSIDGIGIVPDVKSIDDPTTENIDETLESALKELFKLIP